MWDVCTTNFLEIGTLCGGLRASLLADFVTETALVEMQVLGLIGKILTGPWMRTFYTSSVNQIDHIKGIYIPKCDQNTEGAN